MARKGELKTQRADDRNRRLAWLCSILGLILNGLILTSESHLYTLRAAAYMLIDLPVDFQDERENEL